MGPLLHCKMTAFCHSEYFLFGNHLHVPVTKEMRWVVRWENHLWLCTSSPQSSTAACKVCLESAVILSESSKCVFISRKVDNISNVSLSFWSPKLQCLTSMFRSDTTCHCIQWCFLPGKWAYGYKLSIKFPPYHLEIGMHTHTNTQPAQVSFHVPEQREVEGRL